jgi:hypothetical protein
MKIESYNKFAVQSSENKANKQTNIKKSDASAIQNNPKSSSSDVLDISSDVLLKTRNIKAKMESGFYDNKDILQETAKKILKDI